MRQQVKYAGAGAVQSSYDIGENMQYCKNLYIVQGAPDQMTRIHQPPNNPHHTRYTTHTCFFVFTYIAFTIGQC